MYVCYLESEELATEETCDTHLIEQTDKGYRCAIDVPSVLYKWGISKMKVLWWFFIWVFCF